MLLSTRRVPGVCQELLNSYNSLIFETLNFVASRSTAKAVTLLGALADFRVFCEANPPIALPPSPLRTVSECFESKQAFHFPTSSGPKLLIRGPVQKNVDVVGDAGAATGAVSTFEIFFTVRSPARNLARRRIPASFARNPTGRNKRCEVVKSYDTSARRPAAPRSRLRDKFRPAKYLRVDLPSGGPLAQSRETDSSCVPRIRGRDALRGRDRA
ncbi:hypothetical protein EVAR_28238_1 [Eumeta japonica]|uniref:Uncharacterized protein n=1 Tax=Eumeta variegata TaxID=151549 RepID=A0A4C1V7W3_EUMVA|nr:hypothetical protein EVAR_28238_1 [Eumeta japonica]